MFKMEEIQWFPAFPAFPVFPANRPGSEIKVRGGGGADNKMFFCAYRRHNISKNAGNA